MIFYGSGQEFEMLEDAMEAGCIAWWHMEMPSGAVFFSVNKIKMLGYSERDKGKFIHYSSFMDLVHEDDKAPAMKAMADHMSGKAEYYETRYRIKAKNGEYITFYDRGKIVAKNENGEMAIAGIVLDVSNQ